MTDKRSKWPDGATADLDRLWRENVLSARAIGQYITRKYHQTFSVNAVIGKAHRLQLPAKAGPIKPSGAKVVPTATETLVAQVRAEEKRIAGHAHSALSRETGDSRSILQRTQGQRRMVVFDKAARADRRAAAPLDGGLNPSSKRNGVADQNAVDRMTPSHVATFKPILPRHPCRWIEGEPRGTRTVYCDAPSEPGKDWCPVHYAVCYQPARKAQAGQTLGPAP